MTTLRRFGNAKSNPADLMGTGVFEVAIAYKGDAFRVVYAVQLGEELWVVHAFKKKSSQGTRTPKHEIDLVRDRLKRLKEAVK